jgi:hypothetical protein
MGTEGAARLCLDVVVLGGAKVAVPEQRGGQEDVRLWRDNQDASSATIKVRVCGRGGWMVVAARHGRKRFLGQRDNQDEVLVVARVGGRPGPRLRSMAARLR